MESHYHAGIQPRRHMADRPYAHAVALRGSMWFDSEESSPCMFVDHELPSSFRPGGYFQIDQVPPPPAAPSDEVDLTLD